MKVLTLFLVALTGATALAQTNYNEEVVMPPLSPGGTPLRMIVTLAGIGAIVSRDKETQKVLIREVIPEHGAENAGLQANDEILEVGDTSVANLDLEEIVKLLRGNPGTTVTLTIARDSLPSPREVTVTRSVVRLPEN